MKHERQAGGTVVVTGCSSGVGRETALLLTRRGYRVFATMRRAQERGHDLSSVTAGFPGELVVRELDVTDPGAVERVLEEAASGGDLGAVVNNAAIAVAGFFEDLSDEDLREVFETNFFGLCRVTRAAIPHLRRRGHGTIVQVSSGGGRFALPLLSAYAASKHAVEAVSEALRHELAALGIRVVLIEPGNHKTRLQLPGGQAIRRGDGANAAAVDLLTAQTQRLVSRTGGDPASVAEAIAAQIEAAKPRLRHPVGLDVRLLNAVKRFLPFRVWELVIARTLGAAGYPAQSADRPPR